MKAYAVTWDGYYRNIMVAAAPDLDAAKAAVEYVKAEGGIAAEKEVDLDLSGPALVGLHNALAGLVAANRGESTYPSASRFATRADGQRRVFAILDANFKEAPEAVAPPKAGTTTAAETNSTKTNEEDDMKKGNKSKKAAKPKKVKVAKEPKAPRVKKDRAYKAKVVSKGGEKAKASALEMISRKTGATAQEIADKLKLSLGSAKNLVWYLRRDGKKIVVDRESDRKPYVIA